MGLVDNAFGMPTAPGLGVTFDEAEALRRPMQMWDAPRLSRDDGAFTNW